MSTSVRSVARVLLVLVSTAAGGLAAAAHVAQQPDAASASAAEAPPDAQQTQSPQSPQPPQGPGDALPTPAEAEGQAPPPLDDTTRAALQRLARELAEKRRARDEARTRGDEARVRRLEQELLELRWQFTGLAAHLDMQGFEGASEQKFDLESEVQELLRPLLQALKEATSVPRQVSELKARLEQVTERRRVAQAAAARLEQTRRALDPEGDAYREATLELEQYWRPMLDDLGGEILVINANLRRLEQNQKPLVSSVTDSVRNFLESSGLNVVLCVAVFLAVFFGLRLLSDLVLRRRRRERGFSVRLLEVVARVLTVLLAVAATMVVPYARNDWLLLAVGIVFLLGVGWVVVKTAPQFFEQIRLMLNVGAVREGERILVGGLPYRVESLRFYSKLRNPELKGGLLRVPIKDLVSQRSRPVGDGEPWFPCREGDVVALDDGVVGRVALQTPEVVVVAERRDAPRSYPTPAFLAQNPRNLSHGFEVRDRFGVDYRHQRQALGEVPDALCAAVRAAMDDDPDAHDVRAVRVELAAAGSSSLDFTVLVEFGGASAGRYYELRRKVNKALVRACNEHDLTIPFPQLQVHGVAGAERGGGGSARA